VDYTKTDGKLEDVEYLLSIIENDPNPRMRHDLSRLIVHCLSEKSADRRSKAKLPFHNKAIALRLWKKINYDLAVDARLRCDLVDLYFTLFGTRKPVCLLDESQQHLADEITSRRKSPLTIREDVDYKQDVIEEVVEAELPSVVTTARVLSSKRESMASDNSAELPDAVDSSLPTSFEPEMFRTEKEIEIESSEREVKERHRSETKLVETKDGEIEAGESASSHKKHSHHHNKAKKKKEKKKKHKHKHKHKHSHEHKKKVKEETLSSASSASNSPAHN